MAKDLLFIEFKVIIIDKYLARHFKEDYYFFTIQIIFNQKDLAGSLNPIALVTKRVD